MSGTSNNEIVQDELVPDVITGDTLIINPSENMIKHIVSELIDNNDVGNIRVSVEESTFREIQREFLTATKAAELVDENVLDIRIHDEFISGTVIITDDEMRCASDIGESIIITDEQSCIESVKEVSESLWDDSEYVKFRTPPLQYIYDSMRDELGDNVADDYKYVIENVDTFDNERGMDEVSAALLVSAKNNILLYDVSKWGEDSGVASKATFSRTKSRLEDNGYIQTEKVPIDVGRPRLRLQLKQNVFEEDYDGPVITAVQEII